MSTQALHLRLLWDAAAAESLEASQQWILTAMQQHGPVLVSMLWRILGNEQDVCDAYQDTFLQLAHNRSGSKPNKVKAYLFRTASNVAITILRRKKLHEKACRNLAQNQNTIRTDRPGHDLDVQELREELRGLISRLPDYLREVILLRELGELSYEQIAEILGITSASARVYRSRAIQLLAAWMAHRKDR
jgi:RNA polymerase sigma-70 factor (ECF subfamily)